MSRHIDSNRVQCYVDELLVLNLRMAEIRVLEPEKELAAARAPKSYCSKRVQTDSDAPPPPNCEPLAPVVNTSTKPPKCSNESKLVQVELESPKPSNSSRGVQCTLLNPDLHVAKADVEKRDEEKRKNVNVKVQTVTLEDRGVETEQLIEHHVETFVFTARNLPLLFGDEDDETKIEEAAGKEAAVSGFASSSSSGRSSGPTLPPEATADVAALCTRAGEELGLHRRLMKERLEERARARRLHEECAERGVQAVVDSETRAALTDPEEKPTFEDVSCTLLVYRTPTLKRCLCILILM